MTDAMLPNWCSRGKRIIILYWAYNAAVYQNAIEKEFDGKDFIITDNVFEKVNPNATKIEIPDSVIKIDDNAFNNGNKDLIITYKGKNYNLANLDKLKADVNGN